MAIRTGKISKATAVSVIGGLLIGVGLGAGITYVLNSDDGNGSKDRTTSSIPTEGPSTAIPNDAGLPDGTISPTRLVNEIGKYYVKEVMVWGKIIETADNEYSLLDDAGQERRGFKLTTDISTPDLKPYIAGYTDPNKRLGDDVGPVKVTLRVIAPQGEETSKFLVKSVQR